MQKTITLDEGKFKAEIEIHSATILDGLHKNELIGAALQAGETDNNRQTARIVLYPNAMGAAEVKLFQVDGEDKPLDFDAFLSLPEKFILDWLTAAYDVNPHWSPMTIGEDEAKKKA
jgi:hypothetical protein